MKHARARGRVGRIVGSVNPLIPKPGTAYQWLPMEDPAITDRKGEAAAAAAGRHRQRLLQHQVGAAFVLPGAAVARRSARRAGDRGGRAQRRQLARRGRRDRASTPTSTSSATGRSDAVLPWDIIDGGMKTSFFHPSSRRRSARNGRCRRSGRRRTPSSCRCCSRCRGDDRLRPHDVRARRRSRHRDRPRVARAISSPPPLRPRARRTPAGSGRGCGPAPWCRRSAAAAQKLRRSPLTEYCRAGNVTFRPLPVLRSQTAKPISFSPSSGPSREMQLRIRQLARRVCLLVRHES